MPWKEEKDPYKIWLSEIILQQTRVEQGTAYFLRFVQQYPTIQQLAAAPDDDVFKLWEGLGYYSRCKNLLATARYISNELNGKFPETFEDMIRLKGVGPYTAAAICSFAYNADHAVVDGNVNRVLARYFGIATPIDSLQGKLEMNEIAHQTMPKGDSAIFNQAIMDFGATVCKPKLPLCVSCIMNKVCEAYLHNRVNDLPVKEKFLLKKHRWFNYVIINCGEMVLIRKRTASDIWQNLHEFLLIETTALTDSKEILISKSLQSFRENLKLLNVSAAIKQQLTHQTIHAIFYEMETSITYTPEGMFWVNRTDLSRLAFPRLINEFMQRLVVDK